MSRTGMQISPLLTGKIFLETSLSLQLASTMTKKTMKYFLLRSSQVFTKFLKTLSDDLLLISSINQFKYYF